MSESSAAAEAEWSTIFDASTCVRKGLCPVTKIRGQDSDPLESHSLYFEQHGRGPNKIVFVMGLNSSSFSWQPQVEHFPKSGQFSMLVFDNRGVGNSTTPRGPYTTSGMAEDVITLLDYVGWTGERDINVVGISLGGMIAQELASRIPERIISLTLAVTTAGGRPWSNLPPWKGFSSLARILVIKDNSVKVPVILDMVFPQTWLESKAEGDPQGRTWREVQSELYLRRMKATRVQSPLGSISQMSAGLTHSVSPSRLRTISSSIPKIIIVTGDMDNLVDASNSKYLKENMPEAELVQWENTGHAIHIQRSDRYNALVERAVLEGREKAGLNNGL